MDKKWESSEAEGALRWEGSPVPSSGSKSHTKLDIVIDKNPDHQFYGYRIENKSRKESYSISKANWLKFKQQAAVTGSKHFVRLDLGGNLVLIVADEWDILNLEDYSRDLERRLEDVKVQRDTFKEQVDLLRMQLDG